MFAHPTTSKLMTPTLDLSERDNKENLVVKEEETYDAEAFEEVGAEVARFLKEPLSSSAAKLAS